MKKFKFQPDEVMFTADTHFGHTNIIRFCGRPFKDSYHMDEALVENWNRVVEPDQTVFHLGDFAFKAGQSRTAVLHARLNGEIILICGNHDNAATERLFDEVHDLAEVSVEGQRIVLCHYSMRVWPTSHHGSWQLYGHSHGTLPPAENAKALDIGVDSWDYTPVRFDQIAKAMKE
jgi:calcineurin-like phosphoesterase family protein